MTYNIKICNENICKHCKYYKQFNSATRNFYCDYLCMTGHKRNCPAGLCSKFVMRKRKNKSSDDEGGNDVLTVD